MDMGFVYTLIVALSVEFDTDEGLIDPIINWDRAT
jgi:hypothetical protein